MKIKVKLTDDNMQQLDGLFWENIVGGIKEDMQFGEELDEEECESKGLDYDELYEEQVRQGIVLSAKYLIEALKGLIEENRA